jgi:hypothetical protein
LRHSREKSPARQSPRILLSCRCVHERDEPTIVYFAATRSTIVFFAATRLGYKHRFAMATVVGLKVVPVVSCGESLGVPVVPTSS